MTTTRGRENHFSMVEKHLLGKDQFVFVFPFEAQQLFGESPYFFSLVKHNTYWGNTNFFSPFELQQQIRPDLTSCWQQTQPDKPLTADPTTRQAVGTPPSQSHWQRTGRNFNLHFTGFETQTLLEWVILPVSHNPSGGKHQIFPLKLVLF